MNNDSLGTTLLITTNFELHFCNHFSPRRIPRVYSLNLRATSCQTPRKFLFQKLGTTFTGNLHITNANEDKNKEAILFYVSKFLCRLTFLWYKLLTISLNQFLRLTKSFVEICIFTNTHVYIYIGYTCISTCTFASLK